MNPCGRKKGEKLLLRVSFPLVSSRSASKVFQLFQCFLKGNHSKGPREASCEHKTGSPPPSSVVTLINDRKRGLNTSGKPRKLALVRSNGKLYH